MKSGSTNASNQCLPIDRQPYREPKLSHLMACSGANDDTTDVTRVKGPIVVTAHEAGRNTRQSPNRICVCGDYNKVRNLPYL
jgi:hypothetical protein